MNRKKLVLSALIAAVAVLFSVGAPATGRANTTQLQEFSQGLLAPGFANTFPRPSGPDELWAVTYAGNLWPGLRNGPALWSLHHGPTGMYLDQDGNMFLTNAGNNNVRVIYNDGSVDVYAGASPPFPATKDGALNVATFSTPNDIKADSTGFLYVCDREGHSVRRIDPVAGVVKRIAGLGYCKKGYDGPYAADASTVRLNLAQNMAIATKNTAWHDANTIYFNDRGNQIVRKLIYDPATDIYSLYDVAGTPGVKGYVDGDALTAAEFNQPCGITLSRDEQYLLIGDRDNNVVRIIDLAAGTVGTYAGVQYNRAAEGALFADGPADAAYFAAPSQLNVMGAGPIGDLIVADRFNSRVRKITPLPPAQAGDPPVGDFVSTYAGTGEAGRSSGPADRAKFYQPWGCLVDGNLVYIADPAASRVVVIGPAGDVLQQFLQRINAARRAAFKSLFQVFGNYFWGEQTFPPPFGPLDPATAEGP